MTALIITFIIVAIVFAIASLAYVAIDLIMEIMQLRLAARNAQVVVVPEPEPIPEPEPEPEPEIVEEVVLPESSIKYEEGAGVGRWGIVNLGVIDKAFMADETVTLAELKKRGLVRRNVGRIKILADGLLNKPLTVKAEDYSSQAIEMIELMGGTVVILKEEVQ